VAAEEHGHSHITAASSVGVEHSAAGLAVVSLRGGHDLGGRQALVDTLARVGAGRDLLVDLSECTFLDSTVLGVLLKTSQEREADGARLGLVIPPEAHIVYRVTSVTGVAAVLPIYASRADMHAGA
jgi:anti-anti-sigma factor